MFDALKKRQGKLGQDIIWTIGSFGVLAVSGVVINLVITGLRDAASLGVFNLTYAIYVVASQIAAMGIHYSVLRQTALLQSEPVDRGRMLGTAALSAMVLGFCTFLVLVLSEGLLKHFFDQPQTVIAVRYAACGLILFPVTKVLIAFVNGARHMRAFSMLQASRYIIVMVWVAGIAASTRPFEESALGFLVAEIFTICGALIYLLRQGELASIGFDLAWVKKHLDFGSKSLLAGMFVEMNARIDVLLIGAFLSDRSVGIYSFAAMLADGLYHLLAMIRVNFNPLLVAAMRDRSWSESQNLLRLSKKYLPLGTGAFGLFLVASLWVLATYIIPAKGLEDGVLSLAILMVGLTLISSFVPFDNLLMVSGFPMSQTYQQMVVVACNAALNVFLVPRIGIEGAAIATSVGYVVGIVMLCRLSNKHVGWNLITNTVRG